MTPGADIHIAPIKRVDSEVNFVNHAVISKPAYHEEQVIVKSDSAAHHQLNDARIQSSAAASSKFNNAVVDIVPEKRVF